MPAACTPSLSYSPVPLSRTARIGVALAMVAMHAAVIYALLQQLPVRAAAGATMPIVVDFVVPPAPEPPQALPVPPPPVPAAAPPPPVRRPVVAKKTPRRVEPAFVAPPPPEPPAEVVEAALPPPEVVPAAPPADPVPRQAVAAAPAPAPAPAPPAPKDLSIRAVEYLTLPVLRYPHASRRLLEEGRVEVRVLVDAGGAPRETVVVRSSGHARLDEAALATVRATRFKPYTENGVAMPFWVVMPLIFELES